MSERVPSDEIEGIVGAPRHASEHWGRANSGEQTVYVMHSAACLASGIDLRDCEYSFAVDNGIDMRDWDGHEDQPVRVVLDADGWLVPARTDGER